MLKVRITLLNGTTQPEVLAEFPQTGEGITAYDIVTSNLEAVRGQCPLPHGQWVDVQLLDRHGDEFYSCAGQVYRK